MADFHIEMGKNVGLMASLRERPLTVFEKKFLLCAERGDVVSVRNFLETHDKMESSKFDINCIDPLGRTALVLAIENENMGLIDVLLKHGIRSGDSLLHAISEEYVEAVETLLRHEESIHTPNTPYSWERIDHRSSVYTEDITPLILAAHMNNYEILKLLLDRGAAIPLPHDARCGCETCVKAAAEDHLKHSRSRINAYRALCSPSLIALSSRDPILTAFQLSWELRRLSNIEKEFATDYKQLKERMQTFSVSLLDHVRTNMELRIMLNYDPTAESIDEEMHLERVKLAIDYKQKRFVAHPNVQQLLGTVWFQGMPGFRRRGPVGQALEVCAIALRFPLYALSILFFPRSAFGKKAQKPFIKFITYSASYLFFLSLLVLESQRVESLIVEQIGPEYVPRWLYAIHSAGRGKPPSLTEWFIIVYVFGFIWQETAQLWDAGLIEYIKDLWNIVDFLTNCFYINWIGLRIISWLQVFFENDDELRGAAREDWDPYDPMLISEGMFGAGNIFSFMKLVHLFSVHPHMGPLQISLGRMVFDILKFFFFYTWVVFAFGCGMNQLLWYYAQKDQERCANGHLHGVSALDQDHSCNVWRRFSNLFETSQTLFWASFGLVDLANFELTGIKEFTRFWGLLTFGSYSIINVVVLLNLLIAMMSDSYQVISAGRDTEWKFARSKLWINYFDEETDVPPPFNLVPRFRKMKCCKSKKQRMDDSMNINDADKNFNQTIYERVMRCLVRRYVTREQRLAEQTGLVTEDDVNEMKHDIASFKYELFDLLQKNGMKSSEKIKSQDVAGRKERTRERRLLRGFSIGLVEKAQESPKAEKKPNDLDNSEPAAARRASIRQRQAALSRWTTAVTAVVKQNGNQIGTGTETPELTVSLADLKDKVMKEQEIDKRLALDRSKLTKRLQAIANESEVSAKLTKSDSDPAAKASAQSDKTRKKENALPEEDEAPSAKDSSALVVDSTQTQSSPETSSTSALLPATLVVNTKEIRSESVKDVQGVGVTSIPVEKDVESSAAAERLVTSQSEVSAVHVLDTKPSSSEPQSSEMVLSPSTLEAQPIAVRAASQAMRLAPPKRAPGNWF